MDSDVMTMIDGASEAELEAMLNQDSAGTEGQEKPEAQQPNAEQVAEEQKPEKTVEERLKELEDSNAKYAKQLKDKEDFIEIRNAEVGLLRKQLRNHTATEAQTEVTEEEILADPKAAIAKAIERAKEKERLESEDNQQAMEQLRQTNKEVLTKLVPNFDESKATVLELMKGDGAPEDLIRNFEADPTSTLPPVIIFQLHKRAEMQKTIAKLQADLAEAKSKPSKLIDNVTRYAQAKSPITNAPTSAPKANRKLDSLTEADINNMSLEQLKELEKDLI